MLTALKRYGMLVADNGSNWYISGAPSPGWSNDQLHTLGKVTGSNFEVVDTSGLKRLARIVAVEVPVAAAPSQSSRRRRAAASRSG